MVVQPQTLTSTVIQYGHSVYLEHMTGGYIGQSDRGTSRRYDWPKVESLDPKSQPVGFRILGATEGDDIKDGDTVRLQSSEANLGQRNVLGAWQDSHNCYYWDDQYHAKKQGWIIRKRHANGDNLIRYGDEVYFQNLFYKNQRLSRCTWYPGFITTFPKANEWWTLHPGQEPVAIASSTTPSSETRWLQANFESGLRTFSAGNMAYLAYCAEAVYSSPAESKVAFEKLGFTINDHEHFLDFPDTNTQAIAVGDEEKIIIAFRGTENLKDWGTNIKLLKAAWKVGMVHAGFYRSLGSAWPKAMDRLKALRTNNQPIWFTGHSLGGALATLACATLDDEYPDYEIAGAYTFGQPRVGDVLFARTLDKKMKSRFFRIVNNNDMVARIPRIKYQHVGNLLYFDSSGNIHKDMVLSWLSPGAIKHRFQGYSKSLFNLDSDDVGDHRMGDYRLLAMRQLE